MTVVDAKLRPRQRVAEYAPLLRAAADAHDIDPYLLAALAIVESAGNPYAVRVERAFWRRYGNAIVHNIIGNRWTADDRWTTYPDLIAASYGLCQVMYTVAIERGLHLAYPTELCDPRINLYLAAGELARYDRRTRGDTAAALLLYNGGGDDTYPARVLTERRELLADHDFPRLEFVAPPDQTP